MEVLWVRWLGIDQQNKWGFKEAQLPKVGFVPDRADHEPFGFLDPSLVIWECHLQDKSAKYNIIYIFGTQYYHSLAR